MINRSDALQHLNNYIRSMKEFTDIGVWEEKYARIIDYHQRALWRIFCESLNNYSYEFYSNIDNYKIFIDLLLEHISDDNEIDNKFYSKFETIIEDDEENVVSIEEMLYGGM